MYFKNLDQRPSVQALHVTKVDPDHAMEGGEGEVCQWDRAPGDSAQDAKKWGRNHKIK